MNNNVIDQIGNFFKEFFLRFGTPSPKFFKILLLVGSISTFIGYLPDIISLIGFTTPATWQPWIEHILKIAGITVMIASKLTTQSKQVAVTEAGVVFKKTDDSNLPFTANAEQKTIGKENVNVVQVTPTK